MPHAVLIALSEVIGKLKQCVLNEKAVYFIPNLHHIYLILVFFFIILKLLESNLCKRCP